MCTGREDRAGYRPDAGCMTNRVGDREHIGSQRPGGDEWPGREGITAMNWLKEGRCP